MNEFLSNTDDRILLAIGLALAVVVSAVSLWIGSVLYGARRYRSLQAPDVRRSVISCRWRLLLAVVLLVAGVCAGTSALAGFPRIMISQQQGIWIGFIFIFAALHMMSQASLLLEAWWHAESQGHQSDDGQRVIIRNAA